MLLLLSFPCNFFHVETGQYYTHSTFYWPSESSPWFAYVHIYSNFSSMCKCWEEKEIEPVHRERSEVRDMNWKLHFFFNYEYKQKLKLIVQIFCGFFFIGSIQNSTEYIPKYLLWAGEVESLKAPLNLNFSTILLVYVSIFPWISWYSS